MKNSSQLAVAFCIAVLVTTSAWAQAPAPVVTAIGNYVSGGAAISPGSFAMILGKDLAGTTANCATPAGLPTDWCADVLVMLSDGTNFYAAALYSVSPTAVVAQMPVELQAGVYSLSVLRRAGGQLFRSPWLGVTLEAYAPSLYTPNLTRQGLGQLIDQAGKTIDQSNPAKPGDDVSVFAGGLGRTTPVVPTGQAPAAGVPTVTTPKVTVAGLPATVRLSMLVPVQVGMYQVRFQVPADTPGGDQPVVLEIGGKQSNTVLLPVAAPPRPAVVSVVNAASGEPGLVSGSWMTIYGTNLASTSRAWKESDFVGNKLPTTLEGVSVTVNGKPAAISWISPTQINGQVPTDSTVGPVTVELRNALGTGRKEATLQAFAPAFFLFTSVENGKYLAGVHPDGVYLGKRDLFQGALATRPAKAGDVILLFGTGFGATDPAVPAGEIFTGAARLANPGQLTIKIGGVTAQVQFAGLIGAGLYQFNVVVPNVPAGDQAVLAQIGGVSSQANRFITVE